MRFLSVCSGIEAASVAWEPLGWQAAALAEIEPFPCHVLAHRQDASRPIFMPEPARALDKKSEKAAKAAIKATLPLPAPSHHLVPNFGDLTRFAEWPDAIVDLLIGGTPCQSFSVAGLRKGLRDPRGNLALTYLAIAERYRPRWVVWENVPGVLSSNKGRDFGAFLGGLGQLGYGWAYRVLDAQFIRTRGLPRAVPQRRRRVFVVGYLGDWRIAAAVLFDGQSMRGDPPPRREARQRVASVVGGGPDHGRIAGNVSAKWSKGTGGPAGDEGGKHGGRAAVAYDPNQITSPDNRSQPSGEVLHTLPGRKTPPYLAMQWAVRRLTPRECERLQGFPDDYTLVPYRDKPAADGPRYKALGNSMAVNAMQWIGARIAFVDDILEAEHGAGGVRSVL